MRNNLDYFELLREAKTISAIDTARPLRIALLSDAATQQFVPLLRALFHRHRTSIEVYEGAFDGIELETYNPGSNLYGFRPEIILILNAVQGLRTRFYSRAGDEMAWFDAESQKLTRVWDAIRRNCSALVVQSNFVLPLERFFGNLDQKIEPSFYALVQKLNGLLAREAATRSHVLVNDVESVASWIGRRSWFDERLWHLAKTFCAIDHLPLVAQNLVDIVLATRGRGVKCVIVDLDNTLWGGVVGDEGPHGIQIAAHGEGESFHQFQCYLRELKRRGILLAVCSKNELENAIRPFRENPEMVLKFDDMTVFVANWNNKAENIRSIRDTLNIGLDSIVFLDDNPFERNLVRELVPEVIVPELPEDPSDYVKALSELNLFETSSFSAEDVQRSDLYRQEARRKSLENSSGSFEEFLQSLDMKIEVSRFSPGQLARITQLLQRSNQFNLTTNRYNQGQCEEMMRDQECIPLYAKLRDKLGDHGLISIVIARSKPAESTLEITDWLMSCRVLARGVEEYLMNYVVHEARERKLERITGTYIPTAKNAMVKDFYAKFGFQKVHVDSSGIVRWLLATNEYRKKAVFITSDESELVAMAHFA